MLVQEAAGGCIVDVHERYTGVSQIRFTLEGDIGAI